MILPLLVFLVVLIAVLVSFKREHFQTTPASQTQTTPITTSPPETDEVDSHAPNTTLITFIVNNRTGNYSTVTSDQTAKTSLINLINPAIVSEFNDIDLDGSMISVNFRDYEAPTSTRPSATLPSATSSSTQTTSVTDNTVAKSEVSVQISKYYTTLFLTPHINNLKSTFFGDISTYITLSVGNILELYPYDDGEYIKVTSTEAQVEGTSQSVTEPVVTRKVKKPMTDEELLSKQSCVDKENKCNLGYKPYSVLEFNGINSATNKKFTDNEVEMKKTQFSERCGNEQDTEERVCCDPNDYNLQAIYSNLPKELRQKYKKVVVDKCNNKINKIKVCNDDNCKSIEDIVRPATAYELCKLQNVEDSDINDDGIVSKEKLVPDCYEGRCLNSFKLLEVNPQNNNEKITNHYYLIDAVKNNDLNYIKSYFSDKYNNVNESLEYGYPGNTILHQAVFDGMDEIVGYLLTHRADLSKVNKDGNSALHIAAFKGNYNGVHRLIKLGASINCENNMGDTPLHCGVRSGSYNTVLILMNNGASVVLSSRNNHGETPLHTAVVSNKKNLKIVELLVENGSDVHNINKYDKTILGSLEDEPVTVTKESIRTYLQRIYYYKYDENEYNKILSNFPETRPYEVDTSIPEGMEKDFVNYNPRINYKELIKYDNDEHLSDKNLYVKKHVKSMKENIPEQYFNNKNNSVRNNSSEDSFNTNTKKYNKNSEEEDSEEYTEENVTVEHFENELNKINESNTNEHLNNSISNKSSIKLTQNPKSFDKMLIYGSFGSLTLLILILVIIYLKRTRLIRI